MDCAMCEGTRVPATRPRVVERDGRIAVIRDLPVEICDNCGVGYVDAAVAAQLDVLFRQMLDAPVEQAVGHFRGSSSWPCGTPSTPSTSPKPGRGPSATSPDTIQPLT